MGRIGVRLAPLLLPFAVACSGDPVSLQGSGPWTQVSAGDGFTCALAAGGAAYCWGAAIFGQLGNDSNTASMRPSLVLGGHLFRAIASGSDHTCGLAADGTWCWGQND